MKRERKEIRKKKIDHLERDSGSNGQRIEVEGAGGAKKGVGCEKKK